MRHDPYEVRYTRTDALSEVPFFFFFFNFYLNFVPPLKQRDISKIIIQHRMLLFSDAQGGRNLAFVF